MSLRCISKTYLYYIQRKTIIIVLSNELKKIILSCCLQITFHMIRITNYRLNNITLKQKGSSSHKNAFTSRHGKKLQKRNSKAT